LKDEVRITDSEKEEVKDLMKALLMFGMIEESTEIHKFVEKMIKA
jgi:hypothetical protein